MMIKKWDKINPYWPMVGFWGPMWRNGRGSLQIEHVDRYFIPGTFESRVYKTTHKLHTA